MKVGKCSTNTVCPTRYRTRLAGGPLLRVATIRRTADTHYKHIPFHFSHKERVRIIKEMPGLVAIGTHCSSRSSPLMDGENGITCREQLNLTIEHLLNFKEDLVSCLVLRNII